MANFYNSLDHVKVAAPCSADWEHMFSFEGERVRFCSQCNRNVYNLSAMTRSEAAALVYKAEGRLCVKFYRRSDGTMLTQDCPVGLRALRRRAAWVTQVLLGMLLSSLAGLGLFSLKPLKRFLDPTEPVFVRPITTMGLMVVPTSEKGKTVPTLQEKTKKKSSKK